MSRPSSPKRAVPGAVPTAEAPAGRRDLWLLGLAALAVFLFFASARLEAPSPWSYDEYYHLGVARELRAHFPLRAFPWTPFSILADHYADKELLFHVLLMPLAGLPASAAGTVGTLLGQLFFVLAFAWVVRRWAVPNAPGFVLGLAAAGPLFAFRLSMCRPQLLLVGFTVLTVGLLAARPPSPESAAPAGEGAFRRDRRGIALAVTAALFGLSHTGGWVAIGFAAAYGLAGLLAAGEPGNRRRFLWRPGAWTAAGWLAGQLVHPNFPQNFRLLWLQNAVVPFQSAGAGSAALSAVTGAEMTALPAPLLAEQWTAFVAPAVALALLAADRRLRTRATVTAAGLATAFLMVGSFAFQRMLEVGAPLGLLALASVAAERQAQGPAERRRRPAAGREGGWGPWIGALAVAVAALWTGAVVRGHGLGGSDPRAMARFLGATAKPGERVFTAQWGDSAPLFYYAPQARSLVALDPTFFYAADRALFAAYVDVALGRDPDPVATIRGRFGARWVTAWRVPIYGALAGLLARDPRARLVHSDAAYLVWDLAPPG